MTNLGRGIRPGGLRGRQRIVTRRDGSMDQPRRRAPSAAIITTLVVTLSLIWLLLPAVAFADNCVGKDEVK
jgi:hypothetical protein